MQPFSLQCTSQYGLANWASDTPTWTMVMKQEGCSLRLMDTETIPFTAQLTAQYGCSSERRAKARAICIYVCGKLFHIKEDVFALSCSKGMHTWQTRHAPPGCSNATRRAFTVWICIGWLQDLKLVCLLWVLRISVCVFMYVFEWLNWFDGRLTQTFLW